MTDTPRAYTDEEIRGNFLDRLQADIKYLSTLRVAEHPREHVNTNEARELLQRFTGELLSLIEGSNPNLPKFLFAPTPHPDNKQYDIDEGENYVPENPNARGDIGSDIGGVYIASYANGLNEHAQAQAASHNQPGDGNKPREYSDGEIEYLFLAEVLKIRDKMVAEVPDEAARPEVKDLIDCMVHSMGTHICGGSGNDISSFALAPDPAPGIREERVAAGQNYFPENHILEFVADISPGLRSYWESRLSGRSGGFASDNLKSSGLRGERGDVQPDR